MDFWEADLECVKHSFEDPENQSVQQEISEFRNRSGIPAAFAIEVNKIVCLTGNCRKLELRLLWDGVGDYLGFELIENKPLTKTDHLEFDKEDYEKLHLLLSDKESVLMNMDQEALIINSIKMDKEVDGYSGATKLSLREYLVRDAAYTCYVLWHTVYGPIQERIREILTRRANSEFLDLLFIQENPKYKIWAIDYIQRNPSYYPRFCSVIINHIKSGDDELSIKALNIFGREKLSEMDLQMEMATMIDEFPGQRQYELIWKFQDLDRIYDETLLILLNKIAQNKINSSLVGYVYNLINSENLINQSILDSLESLLNHDNIYIRNLTKNKLKYAISQK
ncbi:MAG: hypothetical protein C0433_19650 [Cyclobacterium sp.]|nr:hypothetical protein [Cyclobacterium sp.]